MKHIALSIAAIILLLLSACNDDKDGPGQVTGNHLQLVSISVGAQELSFTDENSGIPVDQPVVVRFVQVVDRVSAEENIQLLDEQNQLVDIRFSYSDDDKTVSLEPTGVLDEKSNYSIVISEDLKGVNHEEFAGLQIFFTTLNAPLQIERIVIGGREVDLQSRIKDIDRFPELEVHFSTPVDKETLTEYTTLTLGSLASDITVSQVDDATVSFTVAEALQGLRRYTFKIADDLSGAVDRDFEGFQFDFYTELDSTLKFPELSDEALLTKVQQQTFKYFWDFAHPVSGLARERNTSGETVTSGGSGFGLMAILVGIERGFITRQEGIDRLDKIITFLGEEADRFHGVWPHWLNGTTGEVIPFSPNDDGGDLVETAFMMQGLLTVRQYLDDINAQEAGIIDKINQLWQEVEWDWYTQGGQHVLYWHWSPNYGWEKNHRITGWNEALIVYVLAASSPTHSIEPEVYTEGWSRSGTMVNAAGNTHYGYTLPLRSDRGGPLFFAHYSFLGLDPRNLSDRYADYWEQNVTHTQINRAYSIANPKNYVGYSAQSWGLTASDGNNGYSAHSPDNDRGVITPTAALSSFPYTPEYSMEALKHFYYILGDRLWGEYGFYDAFNITENWTASSYLAIDQGPIIVMIENYRSGLLWDLFMSAPEVQNGLDKLEFTY